MKRIWVLIALFTILISFKAWTQDTNAPLRKVYILHGYAANTDDHWFKYLKKNIEDSNTQVILVSFPNSQHPDAKQWQQALNQQLINIDENTFFVTHSLGSITLLHFLQQHQYRQIGGIIMVSGFSQTIPDFPQIDPFILSNQINPNYFHQFKHTFMFVSDDDPIVPTEYSITFAKQLKFPYRIIHQAGHFLASDGYSAFPVLKEQLQQMLAK